MKQKKLILIGIAGVIIVIGAIFLFIWQQTKDENPRHTDGLTIVPTMQDKIAADSAWSGTFQLVWNDLINEVVKKEVVFSPQEEMATNLNKQEFKTDMLSDAYYYKKYGFKTLALKAEIEKGIKAKFNQTSDILDLFDWSESALNDPNNPDLDRYFFYVMLYRKFEYLKAFDKLEDSSFGSYNEVQYFGFDNNTSDEVRDQIEVLYYHDEADFALLINTKTNDEVIFYKNPKGNTFKEIYDNMLLEANKYQGSKTFNQLDNFRAPLLKFNELREYDELEGKPFPTIKGTGEIAKAVQTIQFSLDENGGEIKSEAGIDLKVTSGLPIEVEPRNFYVDNTFAIFLREKGKILPYFASRIEDITKFQS